jgi:hypothetical protein
MPKYIEGCRLTYPGIPTADMSAEQWAEVAPELQKKLVEWGMFDVSDLEPKPKATKPKGKAKKVEEVSNVS